MSYFWIRFPDLKTLTKRDSSLHRNIGFPYSNKSLLDKWWSGKPWSIFEVAEGWPTRSGRAATPRVDSNFPWKCAWASILVIHNWPFFGERVPLRFFVAEVGQHGKTENVNLLLSRTAVPVQYTHLFQNITNLALACSSHFHKHFASRGWWEGTQCCCIAGCWLPLQENGGTQAHHPPSCNVWSWFNWTFAACNGEQILHPNEGALQKWARKWATSADAGGEHIP